MAAAGRLGEFNAQGVTNLAWAFAAIEHPAPALFDQIAAQSPTRLDEFGPQGLSNTLWAFAALGHPAPHRRGSDSCAVDGRGVGHTYNLVLILTRHTLARAGLANRLY